ncbi:Ribonucleoside-diphosphate reductase subunit beta [compost metagenome]
MLAQEIFDGLEEDEQRDLHQTLVGLLRLLHENEERYTEQIYAPIGLVDEVKTFLR